MCIYIEAFYEDSRVRFPVGQEKKKRHNRIPVKTICQNNYRKSDGNIFLPSEGEDKEELRINTFS